MLLKFDKGLGRRGGLAHYSARLRRIPGLADLSVVEYLCFQGLQGEMWRCSKQIHVESLLATVPTACNAVNPRCGRVAKYCKGDIECNHSGLWLLLDLGKKPRKL